MSEDGCERKANLDECYSINRKSLNSFFKSQVGRGGEVAEYSQNYITSILSLLHSFLFFTRTVSKMLFQELKGRN